MVQPRMVSDEWVTFFPLNLELVQDVEEEVRRVVDLVREHIDYNWISCYCIDPLTGTMEELELNEKGFNMIDAIQFGSGKGLAAWVAQHKRPVLLSEIHKSQRFRSNPVKSFICCPIIRGDVTIGVINLGHSKTRAYTKQTLKKLLQIVNPEPW